MNEMLILGQKKRQRVVGQLCPSCGREMRFETQSTPFSAHVNGDVRLPDRYFYCLHCSVRAEIESVVGLRIT